MYLLDVFSRLALAKRNTATEKRKLKKIKRPRPRTKNKTPNFRPQMVSILNISSLSFQMTITLHGKTKKDQKKDTKSTWFSFKFLLKNKKAFLFMSLLCSQFSREKVSVHNSWEMAVDSGILLSQFTNLINFDYTQKNCI